MQCERWSLASNCNIKMRSEAGIITSSLSTSLKSTCVILIYNLAQAKSEALVNIYSLLKQNIKSCNAKQAATATKTAKKKRSI